MHRTRQSIRILSLTFLGSLIGCGSEKEVVIGPPLFPVHGDIRIDGEIPVGATIRFASPETAQWGRVPMAIVEPDGSFSGSFASQRDGMPIGNYDVFVLWMEVPKEGGLPVDKLKGKFCDARRPVAKVVIHEGENRLARFELSTKGL